MLSTLLLIAAQATPLVWEPYQLRVRDAEPVIGEIARLKVPENRRKSDSRQIEIAFVRLRSTAENPGDPIIYLDGGPGSSAVGLSGSPEYMNVFQNLRANGDVILLEQRGIGLSKPRLSYPSAIPIPADFFLSEEKMMGLWKARMVEATGMAKAANIDLEGYNTEQNADDVDDVRKALGVEKIRILGFSYGTHLGLSVLRRHGDHVSSAALVGVEGPDMTNKLPMEGDRQIERISTLVAKDPGLSGKIPSFTDLVRDCLAKLEVNPVVVDIQDGQGRTITMPIGRYGLQHVICRDLGDTNDIPLFPTAFYRMSRGDRSMLIGLAQRRYSQYAGGTPLIGYVMDTPSGTSPSRAKQISEEAKTAIFGNAMNMFESMGNAVPLPDLGEEFRSPVKSSVSTLFVSGTLDWNCPPHQSEEVRRTFTKSVHITVENAGHESMMPNPVIIKAISDHFNGLDVSGVKLSLPLKFAPID